MSRIWISLGIFFSVIALCIFEINLVNNMINDIYEGVNLAEEYVGEDEASSAVKVLYDVNKSWDFKYNIFAIFIPHERLEEIGQLIGVAKTNLEYNEMEQFFSESQRLKISLVYLKEIELVKIQNIL